MMTNIAKIKDTVMILKNAKNPQALFQNMIAQNPKMRQAIDYVKENGGDPKAAFEKLAAEKGIDPSQITSLL